MDGTCPLTDLDGAVTLLFEMLATLEAKSRKFYANRYGTSRAPRA